MPELPEVETIRRELAAEVDGRTLTGARVHRDDILMNLASGDDFARAVVGRRVERTARRAKYLLLHLSGRAVLQVQLRMTGRFALGARRPDPGEFDHIAAELDLDDGRTLWYDDIRRLGGFKLLSADGWREAESRLGPEPLAEDFAPRDLARALAGRRAPVKNLLLDQRRVAGVGNIYAAEALHVAAIDPRRPGDDLSPEEVERLHAALRRTLERALEHAGTTLRDFRALNGRSGRYQEELRVYGRDGEPCPRCGETVHRAVQAGRSTFFCPGCQS